MPDITWRLNVWARNGTAKPTIGVDDEITTGTIAALTRFDVSGAGSGHEAEFVAVPSEIDVAARDVLQLQVSEDAGLTWMSAYKGFAVIAGAPREGRFRTYKLAGLKQRFYEIPLEAPVIGAGDVGDMVERAVTSVTLPVGVTFSIADVPLLNFQLGKRYPRLEFLGDFLDELAEKVGSFIVPDGSSYTYDGVTYSPGQVVPAVEWGADADGRFFFRRPQKTAVEVNEAARDVLVKWSDVVAEEVYDRATLIFASEYSENSLHWHEGIPGMPQWFLEGVPEPTPHPIAYEHVGTGGYDATARVVVDGPLDFMHNVSADAFNVSNWLNISNATDNDDTTYAHVDSTATEGTMTVGVLWRNGIDTGIILRVRLRLPTSSAKDWAMRVYVLWKDFDGNTLYQARLDLPPASELTVGELLLSLPAPSSVAEDVNNMNLEIHGVADTRVYEVEAYAVDPDASRLLAEGYLRSPQADVSTVQVVGSAGVVSQTMRLTPVGEPPLVVPVERVEYAITDEDGLVTRYHLGQAYDPELMSQRAVLEALSARIAKRVTR